MIRNIIEEIAYRVKRNPVLVGAAALWGFETLTTGDPITWHSAAAVVVGVLVRTRTVPAHEVHAIADVIEAVLGEVTDAADEAAK